MRLVNSGPRVFETCIALVETTARSDITSPIWGPGPLMLGWIKLGVYLVLGLGCDKMGVYLVLGLGCDTVYTWY